MIIPVNGHLVIEPVAHETFISSQRETFEEKGLVLSIDPTFVETLGKYDHFPKVGDVVFFDSWLAAKFPKGEDEYYWLVKYEDVRAFEHVEQEIPKV